MEQLKEQLIEQQKIEQQKIGIIGLGYVGLPLAIEFAKKHVVVGFDINPKRVAELKSGLDRTREVENSDLQNSTMELTSDLEALRKCNVYIVAVPTPVNQAHQPDLGPLLGASTTVGKVLKKGDVVVYESTVYPGCTEDDCVPVLEKESGLKFNRDFYCGYSPERVNPGDKLRTISKITKVTSGSTPEVADFVDRLYGSVITAGTYRASSIKVAEAAKIIENSQRDINIAFVNELAVIFNKMEIDTKEVLEAAATKWNFMPFQPGLVGGHCIGVDPYYLTHKAESLGYHPEVILAGRRINDNMGAFVANQVVKLMIKKSIPVNNARVLVLGLTFKENCPDIRNTKVVDVIDELKDFGCKVDVFDPIADAEEVRHEYGIEMVSAKVLAELNTYGAIVVAVAHKPFKELKINRQLLPKTVVYDLKGVFDKSAVDARL
jgi:UDP-N-acetyl-D-galactosamine dehydrogenase